MSKRGSYEHRMLDVARMVLTVTHTHAHLFMYTSDKGFTLTEIMKHVNTFFGCGIYNIHFNELTKVFPDVFSIIKHDDWVAVVTLSINTDKVDLLEI